MTKETIETNETQVAGIRFDINEELLNKRLDEFEGSTVIGTCVLGPDVEISLWFEELFNTENCFEFAYYLKEEEEMRSEPFSEPIKTIAELKSRMVSTLNQFMDLESLILHKEGFTSVSEPERLLYHTEETLHAFNEAAKEVESSEWELQSVLFDDLLPLATFMKKATGELESTHITKPDFPSLIFSLYGAFIVQPPFNLQEKVIQLLDYLDSINSLDRVKDEFELDATEHQVSMLTQEIRTHLEKEKQSEAAE